MIILQTSDIHIGSKFMNLANKATLLRERIKQTLTEIVDLALDQKVSAVIFPGDIYDDPYPSEGNINFVKELFYKLSDNNILSIVVPGNHDKLDTGSVWTREFWNNDPNIHVFNDKDTRVKIYESKKLAFYANTTLYQKSDISPLNGLKELINSNRAEYKDFCHIALAHGSLVTNSQTNYPITKEEIMSLGADYLAIGDWHGSFEVISNLTYYSGSPEVIDIDQDNAGHILKIEFSDETKKVINVNKLRTAKVIISQERINLEILNDYQELLSLITQTAGEYTIRNVELSGTAKFDISNLENDLVGRFLKLTISYKNQSSSVPNDLQLEEGTVAYEFDRLMQDRIKLDPDNQLLKKARETGLNKIVKD